MPPVGLPSAPTRSASFAVLAAQVAVEGLLDAARADDVAGLRVRVGLGILKLALGYFAEAADDLRRDASSAGCAPSGARSARRAAPSRAP